MASLVIPNQLSKFNVNNMRDYNRVDAVLDLGLAPSWQHCPTPIRRRAIRSMLGRDTYRPLSSRLGGGPVPPPV